MPLLAFVQFVQALAHSSKTVIGLLQAMLPLSSKATLLQWLQAAVLNVLPQEDQV
jgi:hypothetical protein